MDKLKEENGRALKEYQDRKNEIEAIMDGSKRDIEVCRIYTYSDRICNHKFCLYLDDAGHKKSFG